MPTLNLTVSASADDAHAGSISNDSGRSVAACTNASITSTILSPGSHGGNDEHSAGCRFTGGPPQGSTISSAFFRWTAQATYASGGTISYLVSCQNSDSPAQFTTATNQFTTANRPRTTAVSAAWNQNSVVANTEYSIDITAPVQEVVNRAGYAGVIMVLIDTNTTTTLGEWQDLYSWDHATGAAPKLDVTYSAGGGRLPMRRSRTRIFTTRG